jgi:broad specificity phosphatase PhoE
MVWWFGKKKSAKKSISNPNTTNHSQSQTRRRSNSLGKSHNKSINKSPTSLSVNLDSVDINFERSDQRKVAYILAVSHNTRMQCMLNRLLYLLGNKIAKGKIRLQNCAILQFIFAPEKINISLVYDGELHIGDTQEHDKDAPRSKRQYYTNIDRNQEGYVMFKPITIQVNETTYQNLGLAGRPGETTVLLLERHAQGIHNTRSGEKNKTKKQFKDKYTDAELTLEGHNQATRSGEFLREYLGEITQPIYFCSSNLFRAQQTAGYVIKQMYPILRQPKPITISVVPCLHELNKSNASYIKKFNYNCDSYISNSIVGVENQTKYNIRDYDSDYNNDKLNNIINKNDMIINNIYVKLDWSDYDMFLIHKKKCVNEMEFAQIFKIIFQQKVQPEFDKQYIKDFNNNSSKNRNSNALIGTFVDANNNNGNSNISTLSKSQPRSTSTRFSRSKRVSSGSQKLSSSSQK